MVKLKLKDNVQHLVTRKCNLKILLTINFNMKKILSLIIIYFFLINCKTKIENNLVAKGENYELKIANNQKAVLVLFPCFPCNIENTKNEAVFLKDIENEGISILLLNFNKKLFLSESDKIDYSNFLNNLFDKYKISKKNIFIGGFSSGGNISILLSNHLLKTKNNIQPKGIFVVDSPLDLERLYINAKSDITKNFNKEAVEEGNFIIELLESEIGNPTENFENYIEKSPYLISSNSINNIENLKNIKTRFYCEPDLEWQLKYKNRKYEELNAFQIEKTYHSLINLNSKNSEFIKTKNRGVRANGEKHPHSWNIVERESLIKWVLK